MILTHYGSFADATDYFTNRLHEFSWSEATPADRQKALIRAAQIIDTLNYKGQKAAVCTLLTINPEATEAEIRAADASQVHEFPRGTDTLIPQAILLAQYEIAYALLDGIDPDAELDALMTSASKIEGVSRSYERKGGPPEHVVNGVPSSTAWRYLRPFLRDGQALKIRRV